MNISLPLQKDSIFLPSLINAVYHKGAKNEDDQEGNKHVVDGSDVVHFKQLAVEEVQWNKMHIKTFRVGYKIERGQSSVEE